MRSCEFKAAYDFYFISVLSYFSLLSVDIFTLLLSSNLNLILILLGLSLRNQSIDGSNRDDDDDDDRYDGVIKLFNPNFFSLKKSFAIIIIIININCI